MCICVHYSTLWCTQSVELPSVLRADVMVEPLSMIWDHWLRNWIKLIIQSLHPAISLYFHTLAPHFLSSFTSTVTLIPTVHPRMTAADLTTTTSTPPPCRDAGLVRSAPPLSYVSAMVVPIGRRSNDSACLPLCTFPRWCTPDEETLLKKKRKKKKETPSVTECNLRTCAAAPRMMPLWK